MMKTRFVKYYSTVDLMIIFTKYDIDSITHFKICKEAQNTILLMQQNKNLSINEIQNYEIISNMNEVTLEKRYTEIAINILGCDMSPNKRAQLKSSYVEIEFEGGEFKRVKKFRIRIIWLWNVLALISSFLQRNR